MKLIAKIAVLILASLLPALAQNTSDGPASLGDAARELKSESKTPAKARFSNDTEQLRKPAIPDVATIGHNNLDNILQAIDSYRNAHKLPETEAAIRDWYNQQLALRRNAFAENKKIAQRQEIINANPNDVHPNNHDEYVNLRRTAESADRDQQRQIKLNDRLIARIQQNFETIRPELQKRYGMNVDWFIICEDEACSY
ncbi:MAG TPA: hypothetical protein VGK22_13435 [Candidatus Angelobacter sp.]|jgi:hypothetical protein